MHLFLLCPSLSHRLTVTLPPVSDSQRSQWSSSCLWGCLSMHFITMVISVLLFAEDNRRVPELASTFVPPPPQSPSLLPRPWPPPLPHSDPQRSQWSWPPPASAACTAATCPVSRRPPCSANPGWPPPGPLARVWAPCSPAARPPSPQPTQAVESLHCKPRDRIIEHAGQGVCHPLH